MTLIRWSLVGIAALSGCSSSTGSSGNTPSPVTSASGTVSAAASIGPIPVAAGQEKTVCIVMRLDTDEDMVVSTITADIAEGSHHLVVSKTDDTTENLTPTACGTFSSILMGNSAPLIVVQTPHGVQNFPPGVGVLLPAHQMLRVEAHYVNTLETPIQGDGKVVFSGTPASKTPPYQAAETYIWGTAKISLAAEAAFTTPVVFQAGQAGTHLLSLTTHEHRLGTRVQAWSNSSATAQGAALADDKNWSEPVWNTLASPIDFNGTNGVSFQCSWDNTTADTVAFGESALQEMCFVLGFYYPSRGLDICIDGRCIKRGASDAGAPSDSGAGAP